jgi:hypothetical protein
MWLAAQASRTELLPEGFTFSMGPTEIVVFQLLSAFIVFSGFFIARRPRHLRYRQTFIVIFALALISGVFLMPFGIFQTSSVRKTDEVTLEKRYSNSTIELSLSQSQQVVFDLQITSSEGRFRYYFMTEEEFKKANSTGDFLTAHYLEQDAYVNQKIFSTTIWETGKYFLFLQSDYSLGITVAYAVRVHDTVALLSYIGFFLVVIGTAGLSSYVAAAGDDNEPENPPDLSLRRSI